MKNDVKNDTEFYFIDKREIQGMVGSSQAEIKVRMAHLEDLPPDLTVNQAFWQGSEPFTVRIFKGN